MLHGKGRIGRIVLRNALLHGDIDVVAVNECVRLSLHETRGLTPNPTFQPLH